MTGVLELIHFRSPRFQGRLAYGLARVAQAFERCKQPYIAFSGGKDSTAVAALVHALRPETPLHWSDDELEYPETVDYMTKLQHLAGSQFTVSLGWTQHAGWFWPWRDRPFWREPLPDTLRIDCKVEEWRYSLGDDLTFLGTRGEENRKRRDWLVQGYLYHSVTGWRCCPIWDWTADDVWALIAGWHLAYNLAYDRMEEIGIVRKSQRLGPLPLVPRDTLLEGWPDMLSRLEARYGARWD